MKPMIIDEWVIAYGNANAESFSMGQKYFDFSFAFSMITLAVNVDGLITRNYLEKLHSVNCMPNILCWTPTRETLVVAIHRPLHRRHHVSMVVGSRWRLVSSPVFRLINQPNRTRGEIVKFLVAQRNKFEFQWVAPKYNISSTYLQILLRAFWWRHPHVLRYCLVRRHRHLNYAEARWNCRVKDK